MGSGFASCGVCFFFVTGALDLKSQLADKLHVIPQTFLGGDTDKGK